MDNILGEWISLFGSSLHVPVSKELKKLFKCTISERKKKQKQ